MFAKRYETLNYVYDYTFAIKSLQLSDELFILSRKGVICDCDALDKLCVKDENQFCDKGVSST